VPGTLVVASVAETDQVRALDRLRAEFAQVDALGPSLRVFIDQADAPGAEARVRGALEGLGEHRATVRAGEPELEDIVIALLRATGVDPRSGRGDAAPAPAGHPSDRTPRRARAQSTTPPVQATGLTRDFDGFRAVDEVTFDIRHGEIVGLLGANGAGKTTVIKMLTGILRPSSGTGQVAGVDIRRAGSAIKQRIGYMSQAFSLYTDLTVRENIELYAGIYGLDRRATRERVGALGALGGLAEHMAVPAGRLPMGLRQRLALGCALVHRPEVIFLDEPTSGVDPVGRRQFWDILFRLSREDRVAILVTTHYMNEAEHCDRLALMYAGRIVANASPEQLKRDVEHEAGELVEIALDAPARAIPVLADAGFDPVVFGRHVHVLAQDPARDIPRARAALDHADVRVRSIAQRPLSMEDVFVYRVTALERHGVRGAAS
jgi:ABC-2 type transport system ATP-binding protein